MKSKDYNDDLSHIRSMMERSSRFISLSGLSGIFAGLAALVGAVHVYFVFQRAGISYFQGDRNVYSESLVRELMFSGAVILAAALFSGYFFTARKSRAHNLKIWDRTTKRLLLHFSIPLITGGLFCLGLLYHQFHAFVAPCTLIFYGLALIQAERYTVTDVRYLGYCEVVLGLIAFFIPGWGLVFWAFGFGVLHIVYGIVMYKKYR